MKRRAYRPSQAKRWAKSHGFYYGKMDTTANYYRFRQFAPPRNGKFRVKTVNANIKFIMWYPRGASRTRPANRNRSRHHARISSYGIH